VTKNRPTGVTAVALFTLGLAISVISVFGLLELQFIYEGIVWIPVLLEMYALVVSILMFRSNSRYVWYASVTLWILVIVTCLVYSVLMVLLIPFLVMFMIPSTV
jgi:hypothetical protein